MPPSTIIHLGHIVAVLRRSPAPVASSSPRHAVVLTKLSLDTLLDREFMGRHRAERVQIVEVPCVRYLDQLDREDVRLHQPHFLTLPLSDLQGYVYLISPLIDGHLLDWILVSVGTFLFPMQRSPTCTNTTVM